MLISIEWHKNICVQLGMHRQKCRSTNQQCIRGVFNKFAAYGRSQCPTNLLNWCIYCKFEAITISCFSVSDIYKHSYPSRPWKWKKNDKIRHRVIIRYLDLKGLTTKQVHQDMEATLGEDTLLYSMVKKWAGEFKRSRESLENDPRPGRLHNVQFCLFFHFQGPKRFETANWLRLIICNRKTRICYSFKLAVYSSIE